MKGHLKLWVFNQESQQWDLLKYFSSTDSALIRLAWLEMYEADCPGSSFLLSDSAPRVHITDL